MISFSQYNTASSAVSASSERLDEKAIVINNNAKYGQIVFMAGGAGSGKGFAVSNFLSGGLFKIRDVDNWKLAFLELDRLTQKYPEVRGLNLKKKDDVFKLHMFVKKLGIKSKTLNLLIDNMRKEHLPNIIFDITAKDMGDIADNLPRLLDAGYKEKDIHVVWVLTGVKEAMINNRDRKRVVPEDILIGTHSGAAKTMHKLIFKGGLPSAVDGSVTVVLGNRVESQAFADSPNLAPKGISKTFITDKGKVKHKNIEDFTYITVKKSGKPGMKTIENWGKSKDVQKWMDINIPLTDDTVSAHSTINKTLTKTDMTPQPAPKSLKALMKKLGDLDI